jgi:hypothetical protein
MIHWLILIKYLKFPIKRKKEKKENNWLSEWQERKHIKCYNRIDNRLIRNLNK